MKCQQAPWYDEPEPICEAEATIRIECLPTSSNIIGASGTLFLCPEHAQYIENNSSWTYYHSEIKSGASWKPFPVMYRNVPVSSNDLQRIILQHFVKAEQFQQLCDQIFLNYQPQHLIVSSSGIDAILDNGKKSVMFWFLPYSLGAS